MSKFGERLSSFIRIVLTCSGYAVATFLKIFATLQFAVFLGVGGVVILLAIAQEYFSGSRPIKRLFEIAPISMDAAAAPIIQKFKDSGIDVRMNLQKPTRMARWLWCRRYFKVHWSINMFGKPDVDISYPVRYGISGLCLDKKDAIIAPPKTIKLHAVPEKYLKGCINPDLFTAIFSYPVYALAKEGRQSTKLVGVLSVDTQTPDAYNTFSDRDFLASVTPYVQQLAELAARLYR